MIDRLSPHHSSRRGHRPGLVVLHADAGKTDEGTLSWLQAPHSKVSYHYLVGRDGTVYRIVPEDRKAWHAGESFWQGYRVGNSVNATSIGVAFANDGEEPYELEQYRAGGELVAEICERHGIPAHLIRGHYEVSPGRKTDPYKHFEWGEFFRWFGLYSHARPAA